MEFFILSKDFVCGFQVNNLDRPLQENLIAYFLLIPYIFIIYEQILLKITDQSLMKAFYFNNTLYKAKTVNNKRSVDEREREKRERGVCY